MLRLIVLSLTIIFSQVALSASPGQMAPNFKLPGIKTGNLMSLKSHRGKVVYLDFWASWCGPCRQSLPLLNELRNEFRKKGFEVIAVNLDEDKADAKAFLKQFPVNYPVLLDPNGKVPQKYDVPGMPTSYLIDRSGKIRQVHVGFKKQDIHSIRKQVKSLL
ncbi:MAG: thiol-disulfide isomerase/thioredoxin [Psychrobacter glaciei]|jgi:thiol-disulfide isomerase/thioredoxin